MWLWSDGEGTQIRATKIFRTLTVTYATSPMNTYPIRDLINSHKSPMRHVLLLLLFDEGETESWSTRWQHKSGPGVSDSGPVLWSPPARIHTSCEYVKWPGLYSNVTYESSGKKCCWNIGSHFMTVHQGNTHLNWRSCCFQHWPPWRPEIRL